MTKSQQEEDVREPLLPHSPPPTPKSKTKKKKTKRIDFVDTFRGICLFNMIIGDYAYGVSEWFKHSPWQGMTYDDPTFPSFVFVMGMGIGLSMDKLNDVKFVWRRAATLIFLNLIFQGWYQSWRVETLRIPGVLFRLGWCYGIVGTLCAALPTLSHKKIEEKIEKDPPLKNDTKFSQSLKEIAHTFRDFLELAPQWAGVGFIYAVWFLLTYTLPVPCGGGKKAHPDKLEPVIGYTGPGGIADDDFYYYCTLTFLPYSQHYSRHT